MRKKLMEEISTAGRTLKGESKGSRVSLEAANAETRFTKKIFILPDEIVNRKEGLSNKRKRCCIIQLCPSEI